MSDLDWATWPWNRCHAVREFRGESRWEMFGRCELRRGHEGDHALERGMDTPRWSTDWSDCVLPPAPGCSCAPDASGNIVHNSWSHPTPAPEYASIPLDRLREAMGGFNFGDYPSDVDALLNWIRTSGAPDPYEPTPERIEAMARALGEFVTHSRIPTLDGPNGSYWKAEARAALAALACTTTQDVAK